MQLLSLVLATTATRRAAVENAKPLFLVDEDEDVADWVNGDDDDEGADFFSTQPSNVAKAKPVLKPTSDDEDFEPASIDVNSHQPSSPPSSKPALARRDPRPHTPRQRQTGHKRLKQSSSPSAVAVEANRKPRSPPQIHDFVTTHSTDATRHLCSFAGPYPKVHPTSNPVMPSNLRHARSPPPPTPCQNNHLKAHRWDQEGQANNAQL